MTFFVSDNQFAPHNLALGPYSNLQTTILTRKAIIK